ncbi:gamma-glutamyltransferase [Marinobacter caseinilyticus]|uniref:gamma-glutamyltransferase n=1 Tax=Marinobacter caseinilyticus TaxID=2692195 RepID=UPI00140D7707|nr:gamma-glutamyltransferase [Marinobacter caseinilyticus]
MPNRAHRPARLRLWPVVVLLVLAILSGCASTRSPNFQPAVASAHPLATEVGLDTLANGGNAFDAAVATAAVLGVVEPYSAGIGGGGFWLLQSSDGRTVFVDAREKAPSQAHATMYLDANGDVHPDKLSVNGPLAAGIPGQAAAFAHISNHYGRLPLSTTLGGAIAAANDGFAVDEHYRTLAQWRRAVLARYPAARRVYLRNGEVPETGTVLRQPALAGTLTELANHGFDGFYRGQVATRLIEDVTAAGGLWTEDDLAAYRVIERTPITIDYGPYRIWSAPPPSSGGIAMAQMFGMMTARPLTTLTNTGLLSNDNQPESPSAGTARLHYLTELMRRAYHDRALYLGDPDFTDVPVSRLLDASYLTRQAGTIRSARATPSDALEGDFSAGTHTTHLSVLDQDGNRVSATLSINLPFGSGFLSAQTGVLLNNEMDDFSIKPGTPNAYGLVGGEANKVEPGKRPLSSMSPTLMQGPERSAIIGTPGGSRIITMVYLGLLDLMSGESAANVVSAPRFHHQYLPDVIQHEPGFLEGELGDELTKLGHSLTDVGRAYGNMQLIVIDHQTGQTEAASDPRGIGRATVVTGQ